MKVKFKEHRATMKYGLVKPGQIMNCKKKDALIFIDSGLAVEIKKEKEQNHE